MSSKNGINIWVPQPRFQTLIVLYNHPKLDWRLSTRHLQSPTSCSDGQGRSQVPLGGPRTWAEWLQDPWLSWNFSGIPRYVQSKDVFDLIVEWLSCGKDLWGHADMPLSTEASKTWLCGLWWILFVLLLTSLGRGHPKMPQISKPGFSAPIWGEEWTY